MRHDVIRDVCGHHQSSLEAELAQRLTRQLLGPQGAPAPALVEGGNLRACVHDGPPCDEVSPGRVQKEKLSLFPGQRPY